MINVKHITEHELQELSMVDRGPKRKQDSEYINQWVYRTTLTL